MSDGGGSCPEEAHKNICSQKVRAQESEGLVCLSLLHLRGGGREGGREEEGEMEGY